MHHIRGYASTSGSRGLLEDEIGVAEGSHVETNVRASPEPRSPRFSSYRITFTYSD